MTFHTEHFGKFFQELVRELSRLPEKNFVFSNDKSDWHAKRKSMEAMMFEALILIKTYASHDILVVTSVFEAIRVARLEAHVSHEETFEWFIDYFEEPLDFEELQSRERAFLTNQMMRA